MARFSNRLCDSLKGESSSRRLSASARGPESVSPAALETCPHEYAARGPVVGDVCRLSPPRGAAPSPPSAGRRTSRASQAIACAQLGRPVGSVPGVAEASGPGLNLDGGRVCEVVHVREDLDLVRPGRERVQQRDPPSPNH
jgi:hypothetical protein